MKSIHKITLSICLALALPTASFAGAASGFYLGVGAGDSSVKFLGFDEDDSSTKIFGGYNFGVIPFLDLAVEASYVDFGSPSDNNTSIDITGLNAFGLVGVSFGAFGFFAKAGLIDWDSDSNTGSNSGTDTAYGIGARFALGPFSVRAEYETYELDTVDVDMASVSAIYTF